MSSSSSEKSDDRTIPSRKSVVVVGFGGGGTRLDGPGVVFVIEVWDWGRIGVGLACIKR